MKNQSADLHCPPDGAVLFEPGAQVGVPDDIASMLDLWGGALAGNEIDRIAETCAVPLAVYVRDEVIISSSREEITRAIRRKFRRYDVPALQAIHWTVRELSPRARRRQSAVVEWHMVMENPEDTVTYAERYMLTVAPDTGRLTLAMMEYLGDHFMVANPLH